MRSTNDESDWTVTECATWWKSRRGTSRLGELLAQGEALRVWLKNLGHGFPALVFMIGTARTGSFLALLVFRPHSALAYRPPAPEAKLPRSQALDLIPWSGLQMVPGLT